MNWIDITILVILIYNIWVGYSNGLIRSLFGLIALIGAYFLAPLGKPVTVNIVNSFLHWDKIILEPFALGLSWIIIYLLISLTGTIIWKIISKTPLKLADKIGGVLLGLFISSIIILVPIIVIEALPITKDMPQVTTEIKKSKLLTAIKPTKALIEVAFKGALLNYWKMWMSKPTPVLKPTQLPKKGKVLDIGN